MSISSTSNRMPAYTGNGSTANFPFTFKIFNATELLVVKRETSTLIETILAYSTDYTVSGAGSSSGGSITLTAGNLPTGYKLFIRRKLPLTQTTGFRNQGDFYPDAHEDRFDKQVMVDQQQQDELDRSMKLPESVTISEFNPSLPPGIAGAANKVPTVHADGNKWADPDDWPTSGDIASAVDAANTAVTQATLAGNYATTAMRWAKNNHNVEVVDAATGTPTGEFSAKHYAQEAKDAAAGVTGGIQVVGSRGVPEAITVAGITPPDALRSLIFVNGSGGPITVSANPQIAASTVVGRELRLVGRSDANTLKFINGNGLSLNGDITLGENSVLNLFWDGAEWVESGRS